MQTLAAVATVAHTTRAMAHMSHRMHAMGSSSEAGPEVRPMPEAVPTAHPVSMTSAHFRGALPVDAARARAMAHVAIVVCMSRGMAGVTSAAHHLAEIQVIIVCDFAPAFAAVELAYDAVEALP